MGRTTSGLSAPTGCYQIFSWDNKMDKRGDGSSLACTEGFTSGLYPKWKEEGRNKDHPWAQNKHKIKKGLGLPSVAPGKSPGCAEMPLIQSSTSVVIHAAAPSDSRKKEYKNLQKYQGLRKSISRCGGWRQKWFIDPQAEWVAPAGTTPRISIWLEKIKLALAFYYSAMEQRQQRNYRWACHHIRLKLLWVVTGKYETKLAKKLSHLKQGEGIKRKAKTTWSARHWGERGKGGRGQQPSHLARHITHMHIYERTISLPPSQTHAHRLINAQLSFLCVFETCVLASAWADD